MKFHNYAAVGLALGYLLGNQIPGYSQNSVLPIKSQQSLEQRAAQDSKVKLKAASLHSQLVNAIAEEEERLLPGAIEDYNNGIFLSVAEKVGLAVYENLAKLAEGFERRISLDFLKVYQVNGSIVVDNGDSLGTGITSRMVFYSDRLALETNQLSSYDGDFKSLKIEVAGGKRIVRETSPLDNNFAYVADIHENDFMRAYDFEVLYSAIKSLRSEKGRLRKMRIPLSTNDGDEEMNWYLFHPVDGVKYKYVRERQELIATGLFKRYGIHVFNGLYFIEGRSVIDASDNSIFVGGYSKWNTAAGEFGIINLIIKDKPEAKVTKTIKRRNQPDEFVPAVSFYPIAK